MRVRRVAIAIAVVAEPASAQDVVMFGNIAGDFAMSEIHRGVLESALRSTRDAKPRVFQQQSDHRDLIDPASGQSRSTGAQAILGFRPTDARRRANLIRFVSKSRAVDPKGAAAMERLFANTDVIGTIGQALAPVGLRIDDVADAYAVWWMSTWQAAHSDPSTPTREKAQAVRAQAARALATTPELVRADDAAKQEFAEALLVQAALVDSMMEEYGSDPAMASKLAASVRQGARASGLDLDAMTLTEAGFVPAKKTGAADPAPGAPREALAATGDGKPGYGLLAAAGGAGLGAAFLIGKAMGRRG